MAIKPGRPVAMGVIEGTAFLGLPGNPVASYVTFAYVARPAILALSGAPMQLRRPCRRGRPSPTRRRPGGREYVRAQLRKAPDGTVEVVKFLAKGAGLLSSLVDKPTGWSSCTRM